MAPVQTVIVHLTPVTTEERIRRMESMAQGAGTAVTFSSAIRLCLVNAANAPRPRPLRDDDGMGASDDETS